MNKNRVPKNSLRFLQLDSQGRSRKLMRMKKRPFQLLELMVAIFILVVCVIPVMRIFTFIYQSQQEIVRKNEKDHLAREIHSKFTEKLYKREIPLQAVTESAPIVLNDVSIADLLKKYKIHCEGTFTLLKSYTAKEKGYPTEYLAELKFKLLDEKPPLIPEDNSQELVYDYFIYIDAGELDDPFSRKRKKKRKKPPNELPFLEPPKNT